MADYIMTNGGLLYAPKTWNGGRYTYASGGGSSTSILVDLGNAFTGFEDSGSSGWYFDGNYPIGEVYGLLIHPRIIGSTTSGSIRTITSYSRDQFLALTNRVIGSGQVQDNDLGYIESTWNASLFDNNRYKRRYLRTIGLWTNNVISSSTRSTLGLRSTTVSSSNSTNSAYNCMKLMEYNDGNGFYLTHSSDTDLNTNYYTTWTTPADNGTTRTARECDSDGYEVLTNVNESNQLYAVYVPVGITREFWASAQIDVSSSFTVTRSGNTITITADHADYDINDGKNVRVRIYPKGTSNYYVNEQVPLNGNPISYTLTDAQLFCGKDITVNLYYAARYTRYKPTSTNYCVLIKSASLKDYIYQQSGEKMTIGFGLKKVNLKVNKTVDLAAPSLDKPIITGYIDDPYIDRTVWSWVIDSRASYSRYLLGTGLPNGTWSLGSWSAWTTNIRSITISNRSPNKYIIFVQNASDSSGGNSSASASNQLETMILAQPGSLEFARSGVNTGTLSWVEGTSDTALTYFEVYDGNTLLGSTNDTSYSLINIPQGVHTYGVKMCYNNTDNTNTHDYDSSLETTSANLTVLPTPTLSKSEDYDDVVFRNSEGDDCYLLTDGTFVKVEDYVSGDIKQGITGITFNYPINPGYNLTGVAYSFYSKLGNNAYVYDTDVANDTRTVGLGDTTYGSVGVHKVKVKAIFSDDTDYNSDDSNEVEYPVNTLDAPTLVWGDANHPSSQVVPSGYTPIEYIESDGTQYIDTGYAPPQLAKIDIEFMYLGTEYSGWTCLYGVRGTANTSYFCAFINSETNMLSPNYSTFDPGSNSTTEIVPNGYMHIRTNKGNLYLNSQIQTTCSTTLNDRTTPNCNLYLFALNTASGVSNRNIKARIYDCNIYNDTTQVRQFIPVRRNSDNKTGLYDLLTDTFYTSATEYDFIAGPDIILYDSNKIYESRIEWMPVSTVSASANYADYYFVEVIGNDTVVGNAVTILQPADLTQRVGTWIPDPDPLNGAVKGLIAQLPSQTTDYVVNVRALSFNSWYVGGSTEATASYTINRLGVPQLPEWDPETFTLSWSPVTDANTYYLYDSGTLIKTITGATSYHFLNLEDGLHQFRVTAMKRTFAVN